MKALVVPLTLEDQKMYVRVPRREFRTEEPGEEDPTTEVIFIGYAPCPALVYIKDMFGHKLQVERNELFEFANGGAT
jgi:hypothetical protein